MTIHHPTRQGLDQHRQARKVHSQARSQVLPRRRAGASGGERVLWVWALLLGKTRGVDLRPQDQVETQRLTRENQSDRPRQDLQAIL